MSYQLHNISIQGGETPGIRYDVQVRAENPQLALEVAKKQYNFKGAEYFFTGYDHEDESNNGNYTPSSVNLGNALGGIKLLFGAVILIGIVNSCAGTTNKEVTPTQIDSQPVLEKVEPINKGERPVQPVEPVYNERQTMNVPMNIPTHAIHHPYSVLKPVKVREAEACVEWRFSNPKLAQQLQPGDKCYGY